MAAGDGSEWRKIGGGGVTSPEPPVFGERLRDGRAMKIHNHLPVADRGTADGISFTPTTPWLRSQLTKPNRIESGALTQNRISVNLFDPLTSFGPATIAVLDL